MLKVPKRDRKQFKNMIKTKHDPRILWSDSIQKGNENMIKTKPDPRILWLDSTQKSDENRMLKMAKYDKERVPES